MTNIITMRNAHVQGLRAAALVLLIALIVAMWVPAGLSSGVPENLDVDGWPPEGSGGLEGNAVNYKDGSELNSDCGVLMSVCAAAGAVVIDIDEEIVVASFMGHSVVTIKVGVSTAFAASGGFAMAIPTGSVWVRGWGEVVGNAYSEYLRNGFEGTDPIDDNCFEHVPLSFAACQDNDGVISSGGGACTRALAQAKASNLVEASAAHQSPTEVYAAAETKDTCSSDDDLVLLTSLTRSFEENRRPNDQVQDSRQNVGSGRPGSWDCWEVAFFDLPEGLQEDVLNWTVEEAKDRLDHQALAVSASLGGKEEKLRFVIADTIVDDVKASLESQTFDACLE